MLSPSSMLMLSSENVNGRRLLAAQDSDRGRIRIVNAAPVSLRLFCASVLPSMSVNVILFVPEPGDAAIALIFKLDAVVHTRPKLRQQPVVALPPSIPIVPTIYLPMAVGLDGSVPPCAGSAISVDLDKAVQRPPAGPTVEQDLVTDYPASWRRGTISPGTDTSAFVSVVGFSRIPDFGVASATDIHALTVMVCMFPLASWMLGGC